MVYLIELWDPFSSLWNYIIYNYKLIIKIKLYTIKEVE